MSSRFSGRPVLKTKVDAGDETKLVMWDTTRLRSLRFDPQHHIKRCTMVHVYNLGTQVMRQDDQKFKKILLKKKKRKKKLSRYINKRAIEEDTQHQSLIFTGTIIHAYQHTRTHTYTTHTRFCWVKYFTKFVKECRLDSGLIFLKLHFRKISFIHNSQYLVLFCFYFTWFWFIDFISSYIMANSQ